ncbi:hypothetical protein DTW90_31350 [Neorhizobium sp. P12A]|uniref:hypothetical protein n=1 Tax=Neorhizobium sp. P12A TaxID=2268027 RepID=UPI0011EE6D3E|nr:hypothetical protein [Neorhizobium sp. P12A]KAA0689407.1 hypothetical protein DTW90_31350 [Neorhizobium sp. P12A]
MSPITDFVSELVRAANETDKLTTTETRRLLQRAVITVRGLRNAVGIPSSNTQHDALFQLEAVETTVEHQPANEISAALLDAADLIRTLRIVADSGTRVSIAQ